MIYLDYGATSFHKPPAVRRAMLQAMSRCASPGRGGYPAAEAAAETTSTEVKENLEAAAEAAAEPLLCTLTLKKLMICIQAATYTYQLAFMALAV